jgi:serine/threonine-protein kinase
MKKRFWQTDGFFAAVVVAIVLALSPTTFMQSLERAAYDLGVRLTERTPHPDIAVVAIDDESIANIGRWPWPRDIHAHLIDLLNEAGAKTIAYTVFFTEEQVDPGLAIIRGLNSWLEASNLGSLPDVVPFLVEGIRQSDARQVEEVHQLLTLASQSWAPEVRELAQTLQQAQQELDTDSKLARSLHASGRVLLGQPLLLGEPLGRPDSPLPDYVVKSSLPLLGPGDTSPFITAGDVATLMLPQAYQAFVPIPPVGREALAIGHVNTIQDVDGAVRSEPLAIQLYDHYIPSLSLLTAASFLNLGREDIQLQPGVGVRLGRLQIRTDPWLQMHTFFYADRDGKPAFPVDSFFDVINGKVPADKFRGKIVLVGSSATGVGSPQVTPISPSMPPVVTLAHSVSSILNSHFFVEPAWGDYARLGVFALVALYLVLLMPRLRAGPAALVTVLLLLGMAGTHLYLMMEQTTWLQLAAPAAMLFIGHVLITTKRFLVTEEGKLKTEAESAETNRMLGLQFQGQGQLDMAFEKFRRCPLDDGLMDVLYNLALDYERKRHFAKARAVYEHMATYDKNYKDIKDRMGRMRNMEETVVLGGGGQKTAAGTLIMGGGGVEKPKLGRYDVERELGKGAMGVVYLGRDPKISREVAIKTMALSDEFEGPELEEARARFFREAESAGRLNHPNIVTIYDAGEEQDLAYIAMELLHGRELSLYTQKDHLLPVDKVLDICASAADALDYAHAAHVVHRDIKPANIMYDEGTGQIKITDFGIARVTDSSKTKTGMVLGTPSYMSPEQLSGQKVDGRSDLFSLGVMAYQLLTGDLPFQGDSMATLMYRIANEQPADIQQLRPDLPPCVSHIIHKALEKDRERRYQRGAEMAADLRDCRARLNTATGTVVTP